MRFCHIFIYMWLHAQWFCVLFRPPLIIFECWHIFLALLNLYLRDPSLEIKVSFFLKVVLLLLLGFTFHNLGYILSANNAMGENVRNGNDDIESNGRRFQETPPDVAATMRSLIKSQEEQHKLNAAILERLTDLQKKIDSGWGTSRPEGSKSSTRRRRKTSSGSSDSKESNRDTSSFSHKRKRRRHHRDCSRDEFRKAKPPTFDGEIKTGQEAEAWTLAIKKYF